MRLLYSSMSLAFTQLVRLTLDREGIEFFCSDADSSVAGIAGPMASTQSRIYVLRESDWEHAVELMRQVVTDGDTGSVTHFANARIRISSRIQLGRIFRNSTFGFRQKGGICP